MKQTLAVLVTLFSIILVHPRAHAQTDPDEAYDPFSDYSEFDEASDEEADINFFKNGRFFTVSLVLGPRGYTEGLAKVYNDGPAYGLQLSYFFDLRLALALGMTTSDSSVNFMTNASSYSGNISLTSINADLKYYMNTQNVTRGLADLNPYLLGGFSQVQRTYTFSTLGSSSRDSNIGVDLGAGIEIPLMRKKAFFGAQLAYHYINFPDENREILDNNGTNERLQSKFNGDFYDLMFLIGMNF